MKASQTGRQKLTYSSLIHFASHNPIPLCRTRYREHLHLKGNGRATYIDPLFFDGESHSACCPDIGCCFTSRDIEELEFHLKRFPGHENQSRRGQILARDEKVRLVGEKAWYCPE
jgi:hypothetical protein